MDLTNLSGRAIQCDGLTRRFGEIAAVDGITLDVEIGEVFGFLGHNGAGKTTTVRLLNGVIKPDAGSARVLGLDPSSQGPELRRCTGVLTETPSVDERLTARENLLIYAELYGVSRAEAPGRAARLLETFGLSERADEKAGAYSKGMKHRLALARALLHEPDALFLDEPTSGLDPVVTRQVHELIKDFSHEARTVFICTHNLAEAQRLCDRVAVLEHGRIVAMGTPHELARDLGGRLRLEIELASEGLSAAMAVIAAMPELSVGEGSPFPNALALGAPSTAAQGRETQVRTVGVGATQLAVTGATRDGVPDLIAALTGAGVRIYRVTPHEASLEDVYFALHDRDTARTEDGREP